MSIASFAEYCPLFFACMLFGAVIDNFDAQKACNLVFGMLAVFSILGILVRLVGNRVILRKRRSIA